MTSLKTNMPRPEQANLKRLSAAQLHAATTPLQQSVWTWLWGGLLLAGLPILTIYFSRMWRLPHYQYFPFAIAAVGFLAWSRSDRRFYPPTRPLSIVCLALGGIAFVGGLWLRSPWIMAIAFFLFATGCLNVMRGKHDHSLLALALPLALLVRLPLGYDNLLVLELQPITTMMSSLMLDVVGVPHAVSRNVIQMADRELFVAEACSGIQSVFTLAFLSTLLIAVYRRRLWLAPLYLLIACLLAVAGNVLRVTTVAVADYAMGWNWADGWSHDLLGYFTLAVSVLFLISFDQLVIAGLHPTGQVAVESKGNPLIRFWNWCVDDGSTLNLIDSYFNASRPERKRTSALESRLSGWMRAAQTPGVTLGIAILMAVLLGVSTVRAFSIDPIAAEGAAGMFVDGLIFNPAENEVEAYAVNFQIDQRETSRGGENPILGQNADVWRYTTSMTDGNKVEGQFVISQTYAAFHELCLCYANADWELLNRFLREPTETTEDVEAETVPAAYATFRTPSGGRGYLWYASITQSGGLPQPPARPGRLGSRLSEALDATPDTAEPMLMIQIWVTSKEPLDTSSLAKITNDFAALRGGIAERMQLSGRGSQTP